MINISIRKFYALTDVELNAGTGGAHILVDSVGGGNVAEVIKMATGTEGNLTLVSAGDPMPVTDAAAEVSVASIDLKTPTVGQKAMVSSSPVVIASDQSAVPVSGPLTDTQLRASPVAVTGTLFGGAVTIADGADIAEGATTDAAVVTDANGTVSGKLRGLVKLLSTWIGTLGQKAMANSAPVVIASDQTSVPVTAAQGTATNLKAQAENYQGGTAVGVANPLQVTLANTGANSNKILVTPDSVALPANQSVNVAQVAGNTTKTNSGTGGAGSLNVYIATDQPALTNALQVKSTQKPSIGATVALAVTALQSLTSSATVGWGSVRVSNLTTLATDYEIMVKLTTANTAPASDKCMYVFIVPWYTSDAGSTWFPSSQGTTTLPSGTDAGATIASPHNLRLLGVLNYSTAQMVVQDTFLLSNCFGNRMPDGFSVTIINFSGATLSTGCIVDYSPLNDILV